eukprot:TRINITY_DN841_c0_g1_i2.p1 TRINITY_DN841_c0_g1~~TRINITY_DN841_c0_g1_i2.p1  ORF type:complete len:385 (-),score=135.37 TRINITY_DN841_c0_g1_i2:42-1196(-)
MKSHHSLVFFHQGTSIEVSFPSANEYTIFGTNFFHSIEQIELNGGIFGRDLREIFIKSEEIPEELQVLGSILSKKENASIEGIFRITGRLSDVRRLKICLSNGTWKSMNLETSFDIQTISAAFSSFFKELPEPLFSYELYDNIAKLASDTGKTLEEKYPLLRSYLSDLPSSNRRVIAFLLKMLGTVSLYSDKSKMNPDNLAMIFYPTLFRQKIESSETTLMHLPHLSKLLAILIFAARKTIASQTGFILSEEQEKPLSSDLIIVPSKDHFNQKTAPSLALDIPPPISPPPRKNTITSPSSSLSSSSSQPSSIIPPVSQSPSSLASSKSIRSQSSANVMTTPPPPYSEIALPSTLRSSSSSGSLLPLSLSGTPPPPKQSNFKDLK